MGIREAEPAVTAFIRRPGDLRHRADDPRAIGESARPSMASPPVPITLVVCTRNRAQQLPLSLEALARLKAAEPWQLIIVNNGSTDTTQTLLESFAQRCPRCLVLNEPTQGLSNAQNTALRHSYGEIIAFTDDDCYPDPDYLEQIRQCFAEHPIEYLGGRVLLFDPLDAPITIQPCATRVELSPYGFIPSGMIHGAAFAFRRRALDAIGGFDPAVGPGSELPGGNDFIALVRCAAMGMRGAYDPRPLVYHHHRRRQGSDVNTVLRDYDLARGAGYFLGISSRTTRRAFAWPIVRRIAANILKGRWGTFLREASGAFRYYRIQRRRGPTFSDKALP
jgi:glycosyltransferase involved in cell wall biosynthesis